MSTSPCLAYATIALAKAVEIAAHLLGVHSELLGVTAEAVIMAAYIKLARTHR